MKKKKKKNNKNSYNINNRPRESWSLNNETKQLLPTFRIYELHFWSSLGKSLFTYSQVRSTSPSSACPRMSTVT